MNRTIRVLLLCLACGCANPAPPPPPAPVTAESLYLRVAKTTVYCLAWLDGTAVIVWADIDGNSGGGIGPCPSGVAYAYSVREQVQRREWIQKPPPGAPTPPLPPGATWPIPGKTWDEETGRAVSWRCETADGKAGTLTINGQLFDMSAGNVFLVSTVDGGKVTPLARDLSKLEAKRERIAALAKDDETIRAFVEAAVPSK